MTTKRAMVAVVCLLLAFAAIGEVSVMDVNGTADANTISIDPNAWKFDAPVGPNDFVAADPKKPADGYVLTDAAIRLLCESGRVCEVMGHRWEFKAAKVWKCCVCGAKRLRSHGFWIYPKTGRILDIEDKSIAK